MKLSYSDLAVYLKCPLQYHWQKKGSPLPIDQMPRLKNQFIGHLLQSLLEAFYLQQWWRKKDEVIHRMRNTIPEIAAQHTKTSGITWWPGELENWIQIAQETVAPILAVIKAERLLAIHQVVEHPIQIPVGDHTVYGRIDFAFLHKRKDGTPELTVIDGKAGKQYGRYTDKQQLIAYAAGARGDKTLARTPDRAGFWFFRHGKIQWHNLKSEKNSIQGWLGTALEALDRLEQQNFEPTPGSHCRLCDFRRQCEAGLKYIASTTTQIPELDIPDNAGVVSL